MRTSSIVLASLLALSAVSNAAVWTFNTRTCNTDLDCYANVRQGTADWGYGLEPCCANVTMIATDGSSSWTTQCANREPIAATEGWNHLNDGSAVNYKCLPPINGYKYL